MVAKNHSIRIYGRYAELAEVYRTSYGNRQVKGVKSLSERCGYGRFRSSPHL